MSKRVPACLARFPVENKLATGRNLRAALARLVYVLLMLHGNAEMFSWVGKHLLGWLTRADPSSVGKALSALEMAGMIERVKRGSKAGMRLCLLPAELGENPRPRVFWPRSEGGDQCIALLSLVYGTLPCGGKLSRNRVAAIVLMYQFSRAPSEGIGETPQAPHYAWVAGVLGTSVDVVYQARDAAILAGLARRDGRLIVFEDPGSWHPLMGKPQIPPRPYSGSNRPKLEIVHVREETNAEIGSDTSGAKSPGDGAGLRLVRSGEPAQTSEGERGDGLEGEGAGDSEQAEGCEGELVAWSFGLVCALAALGWEIRELLGFEIIVESIREFGLEGTRERLAYHLAGPYPSYALEPLGAELGPKFECPYQLVWSPQLAANMRASGLPFAFEPLDLPSRDTAPIA